MVAGERIKELIVYSRHNYIVKAADYLSEFGLQRPAAIGQLIELRHIALDRFDVGNQRVRIGADAGEALIRGRPRLFRERRCDLFGVGVQSGFQRDELILEGSVRAINIRADLPKVFRRGSRQAGRGRHQSAAVLRHAESRHKPRDAVFVHAALRGSHLIERKPADQTCRYGKRRRAAYTKVELGRYAKSPTQQSLPHSQFSLPIIVSTG